MLRQIPAANHPDSRPTTRPKSFRFKISWQRKSGLILQQFATFDTVLDVLFHVGARFIFVQMLECLSVSRLAQKSTGQMRALCLSWTNLIGEHFANFIPTHLRLFKEEQISVDSVYFTRRWVGNDSDQGAGRAHPQRTERNSQIAFYFF